MKPGQTGLPAHMVSFGVTYDYRCPFARIAHEHVVEALEAGADWDVTFVPFSLGQVHVEHGQPDVWDEPSRDSGLLALQASVVVREQQPDRFLKVHRGLFDARHHKGRQIKDEQVVRDVLAAAGADGDAVFAEIADGWPLETIRKEHDAAANNLDVWGVPTFMTDEHAAFVRLMERPRDADDATRTVERIVDMLRGWPQLNEFKHTSLAR
jgi:2-hydroxychromene-2-carboxylate isomerase